MAHQKTIEAYAAIGDDWQGRREKGIEYTTRHQKALIEKDTNKVTKVGNVYRMKIADGSEIIFWDQHTTGKTGIGNPITYYEDKDDLCIWYEPIPTKEIRFNAEKQEQEVVIRDDIVDVITHYLYPFNAENIAMIKKITANNQHCNWYVKDLHGGKTQTVKSFDDWSTKSFDELINPNPNPLHSHNSYTKTRRRNGNKTERHIASRLD